jgi:hypothetical protein
MDFHTFTTNREACSKSRLAATADEFYAMATAEALAVGSQFYQQLNSERTWEDARKPYYNVWPSIVPMLTRLNLDLDSGLIHLPLPALCIRLPKHSNPLAFRWEDQPFEIRSLLLSEINEGRGLSILIDIGETMENGLFEVPIFTYRNFPRREGVTVEQSLASLGRGVTAGRGRADPRDADRRLRAALLFAVPAGERPIGDRAGRAEQGPRQIRGQRR